MQTKSILLVFLLPVFISLAQANTALADITEPKVLRNHTEIVIDRPPSEVFDYVTVPNHWMGSHPVTVRVEGDTHHSEKIGDKWTEVAAPFHSLPAIHNKIHWTVLSTERPYHWQIQGYLPMGPLSKVAGQFVITYTFDRDKNGKTIFKRDMATIINPLFKFLPEKTFLDTTDHTQYLRNIKNILEGKLVGNSASENSGADMTQVNQSKAVKIEHTNADQVNHDEIEQVKKAE